MWSVCKATSYRFTRDNLYTCIPLNRYLPVNSSSEPISVLASRLIPIEILEVDRRQSLRHIPLAMNRLIDSTPNNFAAQMDDLLVYVGKNKNEINYIIRAMLMEIHVDRRNSWTKDARLASSSWTQVHTNFIIYHFSNFNLSAMRLENVECLHLRNLIHLSRILALWRRGFIIHTHHIHTSINESHTASHNM